jgi:chromate transporter
MRISPYRSVIHRERRKSLEGPKLSPCHRTMGGLVARRGAVLIAFFGPTAVLAFVVARLWKKLEKRPWRTSIQQGLAPVSIGLLPAGCFTMATGAISGVETAAIALGVLLILQQYKVNPALLVVGSAVLGVFSFIPK